MASKFRGASDTTPLTVKQIADAQLAGAGEKGAPFAVDGVETANIRVVGTVSGKAERATDVSFTLDDSTGRIDFIRWGAGSDRLPFLDPSNYSFTTTGDLGGNGRETFMDLLATLLVSKEFKGIVSSAETRSSRDSTEQAEAPKAGDGSTIGETVAVDAGTTVSSSPEGRALVWLAAITSVMLLVSSNIGG